GSNSQRYCSASCDEVLLSMDTNPLWDSFCDTPHLLKPSGFCAVASTDVFSSLQTSYAGMRGEPYARGGCHLRNNVGDTKFPTILVPDVSCSNSIPVQTC